MKSIFYLLLVLGILLGAVLPSSAQVPIPPAATYQPLSAAQLDQELGPIALYPDPLIAQILPAATLPAQIVIADRYVTGGGDPSAIGLQPWDTSVQAVARYPNVLKWMDDNLAWTTELGQAFLNQQQDVMDSIQRLRASAANLGNLQSTPQQTVVDDGGYYDIDPTDPNEIYVPTYQPDQVYEAPYNGVPYINFGVGFAIGGWLDGDFDWRNHDIRRWDRDHPRPSDFWHQPPSQRNWGQASVWRPTDHRAGTPSYRGDRGYSPASQRPLVGTVGHSVSDVARPRQEIAPTARQAVPAPYREPAPAIRQETLAPYHEPARSAFSGIQSAPQTRASSDRGHQSMGGGGHVSAPAVNHGGGGGGGDHVGSSNHR